MSAECPTTPVRADGPDRENKLHQGVPADNCIAVAATGTPSLSVWRIGSDPEFAAVVASAVLHAFPGSLIADLAKVPAEPAPAGAGESELLALCEPERATLARAVAARDGQGLPRWAVVVFGPAPEDGDDCDFVPRGEWRPEAVASVFRAALRGHRLRRENARLRGDLATFGFRVAHDLRTPLGGVTTTTEMLREVLAEDAPKDVALTDPILDSAEGLVRLIERTSFFAKANASGEPPRRLRMSEPFWNAFQQIESALMKAGAAVGQPSDWPQVDGRGGWLEVVWRNLLLNAVQHGAPGGRIEVGWTPLAKGFRFWVRSPGEVPVAKRATLFYPFHRLHEPGAPRGLGLPIVQRLVELDGGDCGYEPVAGGSLFYFQLPAPVDRGAPAPAAG